MKINQLIQERNKRLYETGVLFVLLIAIALFLDRTEPSLLTTIFSTAIKLASLYGLILLSRRIRTAISCPCCNADLSFEAYAKTKNKICPFCKIRFDQESEPYKRKLSEMKANNEHEVVMDEGFFDN